MGFLGRAGTSFLSVVLMVRPKLSQAVENPSISSCISCSLLTFSAQSSANRRSLITVSFTLVTACRRWGLNRFSSHLHLMGMPGEVSLKASVSIAENIRLNSMGARTQPCFTPFVTGNGSEAFPSSSTRAIIPSGQPNLDMTFHSPSLLTVSPECFLEVYECHVQVPMLFHALLL